MTRHRRRSVVRRHVEHEAREAAWKLLLAPILIPLWMLRRLL